MRPMKGGCQEKTSPVPAARSVSLQPAPLRIVFVTPCASSGLSCCSPILLMREELSAERAVW